MIPEEIFALIRRLCPVSTGCNGAFVTIGHINIRRRVGFKFQTGTIYPENRAWRITIVYDMAEQGNDIIFDLEGDDPEDDLIWLKLKT